ncbi:MAG TPA: MBL fold metallo-hydrolase [Miltoncostaeaceae bacterium]|nr:MBL fold metallo-hydrolase [Miltoncostaeaceae bacterium]
MEEIAPGVRMIDTLLAGWTGVTAAYLVMGEAPALVDTGARTSAQSVRDALAAHGVGRDDLRWIVLTHVHLDHCGATGILARAHPRARVVVHVRGARHLVEPGRLVAGTAAVHGPRWSLYGGLDPTPADRIDTAEDGQVLDLGGGRRLRMVATPGHARHHMAVLDEATGTVMAGDALGLRFRGAGAYPALPPPEIDPPAGQASLDRLEALRPAVVCPAHFGPVPDPAEAIADARRQLALAAEAARAAPDRDALAGDLERAVPMAASIGDPDAVALLERLGWAPQTVDGLWAWRLRERRGLLSD